MFTRHGDLRGDILFQRSTDGGESFERSIMLSMLRNNNITNPVSSTNPIVTALNNDKVCVAWENSGPFDFTGTDIFAFTGTNIFLRCSSDKRSSIGNITNLSNNTSFQDLPEGFLFSTAHSNHPDMSAEGDALLVVWENSGRGVRQIIFTRSVSG